MDFLNSDPIPISIPIPIPIDLFVSKKHDKTHKDGDSYFLDSGGKIIYKVNRRSLNDSSSSPSKRVLRDAAGIPLISIHNDHKGCWQCYKGDGESKDFLFRVMRTKNTLTRTELEVFLVDENLPDISPDLKVKGFPFQRACTIYKGNDIVAQVCYVSSIKTNHY